MYQVQKENEAVLRNLRKLLGATVRSVQWSYAIFWSVSQTQQGVLEWGDGYYNGDVTSRKTHQAMEVVKADKMGLQRSKQLRELYESLSEGENTSEDEHSTRPCGTSLSPEDLSDAEWFYVVSMSFVFRPGQGLPGRALALDGSIWLCNAQYASRKVFARSLLAKSASVQTVLCFPYTGGIMELGSTEIIPEDPALILHIKTILLDFSKPNCYVKYTFYSTDNDEHPTCVNAGNETGNIKTSRDANSSAENIIVENREMSLDGPSEDSEDDLAVGSPDHCSFTSEQNHQFTNDQGPMNSSNCASKSKELERCTDKITTPKSGAVINAPETHVNGNSADLHYRRAIAAILKKSNFLTGNLGCSSCVRKSSFGIWRNLGSVTNHRPLEQQKILKKMLFAVPVMHGQCVIKPEIEYIEKNAVSERQDETLLRLENNRLFTLRSMIPSAGLDKAYVLEDTIKCVQQLEERLGELDSNIKNIATPKKEVGTVPPNDMVEQILKDTKRKTFPLKRKACEDSESNNCLKVQIFEQQVLIEISCTWREYLLLDIMDALNRLQLDAHIVQSSTQVDGAFTLKVISKFRRMSVSARVLKQFIWESICQ